MKHIALSEQHRGNGGIGLRGGCTLANPGMRRQPHRMAFTLVELLVVIGIIVVLLGILIPVASRAQESARRVKCASNLRQIGQAILGYASNNDGRFPRVYFHVTGNQQQDDAVALVVNTNGKGATNPFRNDPTNGIGNNAQGSPTTTGYNNIPASFFLLLRARLLTPEVLLCPSQVSANLAEPDTFEGADSAATRSNFSNLGGVTSPTNLSYSIQVMYPRSNAMKQGWTWDSQFDPEAVLAADLNPGKASIDGTGDLTQQDLSNFGYLASQPDKEELIERANSRHHRTIRGKKEGQNVLFGDFHVEFRDTPFCGQKRPDLRLSPNSPPAPDCIYTIVDHQSSPSTDVGKHKLPDSTSTPIAGWRPDSRFDTILLPTAN